MNKLQITKAAKLEDLAMWSLMKNILEQFPEMKYYIKTQEDCDEMEVKSDLKLNTYLFKSEPELFAEEDILTLVRYLDKLDAEKIDTLTLLP